MLRPVLVGTLLSLAAASSAQAAPTREDVEARLGGYERAFSGADLVALGPGADRVLAQIADDTTAKPLLRARAVSALGYARTPPARAFLELLLKAKGDSNDGLDKLLLRKAAVALGWQNLPDTVPLLLPLLRHADEQVRLDAVVALGLTHAAGVLAPLKARLPVEPAAAVRLQIEKQVRLLDPAASPEAAGK